MTIDKNLPPSDAPVTPVHHATDNAAGDASKAAYSHHDGGHNVATIHHHYSGKSHESSAITAAKPLTGLNDARIEKAAVAPKDATGAPLEHRKKEEVNALNVRLGHKKGDQPANYVIDNKGQIKEQRSPDTRLHKGDSAVTIEVQSGTKLNKDQQAAMDGLVKAVKKDYPASKDAQLTPEMQDVVDRTAAGPALATIAPNHRGGGVKSHNGKMDWGSHGGDRGGNGGRVPSAAEAHAHGDQTPFSAPVDWSKLPHGLKRDNQTDRIAALISSNEGKPTSINWNDNGAGISVGMYQANQRKGELPKLFNDFASTKEGFDQLVKLFGEEFAEKMRDHPESVRSMQFSPNNQLGQALEQLVQTPAFQQLQLNEVRAKIQEAGQVAQQHGITSEAGVALVADVINQFGSGGANGFLRAADGVSDQQEKARAIARSVQNNSKYGARYSERGGDLSKMESAGLSYGRTYDANQPRVADA